MEVKELSSSNGRKWKLITCDRKELKIMKASDYKHGDVVRVGKYYIYICYGTYEEPNKYDIPSLCSYVELENGKKLDCMAGTLSGFTPYFIDDFKSR